MAQHAKPDWFGGAFQPEYRSSALRNSLVGNLVLYGLLAEGHSLAANHYATTEKDTSLLAYEADLRRADAEELFVEYAQNLRQALCALSPEEAGQLDVELSQCIFRAFSGRHDSRPSRAPGQTWADWLGNTATDAELFACIQQTDLRIANQHDRSA